MNVLAAPPPVIELTENNAIEYARLRGLIGPDEMPRVEALAGGVACAVLRLHAARGPIVIKQARERFQVKETWLVDPRRNILEARFQKLASEYHLLLSIQQDRFTGPVVPAGGSRILDWQVDETTPANVQKITPARDPTDGHFYIVVLDGVVWYYVADINERHLDGVPPAVRRCDGWR